jgi:hypothetical protein
MFSPYSPIRQFDNLQQRIRPLASLASASDQYLSLVSAYLPEFQRRERKIEDIVARSVVSEMSMGGKNYGLWTRIWKTMHITRLSEERGIRSWFLLGAAL